MTYDNVLEALGDGTRRRILALLRQRPMGVGELTERLPVSQPAVSQHLKVLRNVGLVRVERRGARRIHGLSPAGFRELRSYVDSFWDEALEAFGASFRESSQPSEEDEEEA